MAKLTRTILFPNTGELKGINIQDNEVREGLRLIKKWADKLTFALESNFGNTYNSIISATGHNFLSTTHTDTQAATIVRGDVLVGNSTPEWARIAIGSSGEYLRSDGSDAGWSTILAADLSGAPAFDSGVKIGNLTLANGSITDSGGTISFGNEFISASKGTFGTVVTGGQGLYLLDDIGETYYLIPTVGGTELTANRLFTIDVGNAARTLTLSGDATFGDWFDQSVKAGANVTHNNLTLGGYLTNTVLKINGANIGHVDDEDLLLFAANILTVNGAIYLSTNLLHLGDTDTGILLSEDEINFIAGNLKFLTLDENLFGSDEFIVNTDGVDIDFRVEAVGQTNALFVQGSDGKVGVRDAAPGSVFDVTGDINTTEQYKVDDVQVVSNQQAHIADATTQDLAGADTVDETKLESDLTGIVGTINSILTALETHGLLAAA